MLNLSDLTGGKLSSGLLELRLGGEDGASMSIGTGGTDFSVGTIAGAMSGLRDSTKVIGAKIDNLMGDNRGVSTIETINMLGWTGQEYEQGLAKDIWNDIVKARYEELGTDENGNKILGRYVRGSGSEILLDKSLLGEGKEGSAKRAAVLSHEGTHLNENRYEGIAHLQGLGTYNAINAMFRLEADGELYNSMLSGILNPESWMENTGDVDNWALMGDGTLVKDKDGWLKDENGMYINKDGSRSWQVTDKTIGAKDIVTGLLNILNEGTSKIPYTEFSDSQIEKVHALLTNSGFVHSEGDMRDVKWDEGNDNASIPFSNIINGGFGDSVAPAVFINGYDVSTDMLLFGDGNEWESIHTNIPDYVYNRYIDLAATKGLFYNTIQALVGGETRISWPYKKESDKDLYINYNNYHYGIDIAGQEGLPVYAGISGKITDVTGLHEREGYSVRIEYGYQFEGFTHTTGITGEYLHLQNKSDAVIGQFVSAGTQIGKLGNTGSVSTGPHLHYTVFTKPGQTYATNVALRIFGKDYMDTAMPNKPPNNIPSTKTVYDGTSFYERYRSKYQK